MGDIKVGDTLFDENGLPCRVIASFETQYNKPCYRVSFSDGTSIVADEEHLWQTTTRIDKPNSGVGGRQTELFQDTERGKTRLTSTRIRTTKEIKDTLTCGTRKDTNHSIPVAGSLALPEIDLPIHPYILGVWLGDGDSDCGRITCSSDDLELLNHVHQSGITSTIQRQDIRSKALRINLVSLATKLKANGLLKNKHIPKEYLRASSDQRLALLQGLMDTDGYCSKSGQCEFTTTNPTLRGQVLELIRSLGYKPTLKIGRSTLNKVCYGESYRIQFWAFADRPVFRLSRKRDRLKLAPKGKVRSLTRQIVSVEQVESVPVRCIAVDSPSKLFLAGEGMIPTHNTPLICAISLYVFFCDPEQGQQCYVCAGNKEQANIFSRTVIGMIENNPVLKSQVTIRGASEKSPLSALSVTVVRHDDNSFMKTISSIAETKHGFNVNLAIIEEVHAHKYRDLYDTMQTAMVSANRLSPLLIGISTADKERVSICNEKLDYSHAVQKDPKTQSSFLPIVYEPEPGANWRDEKVWKQVNPNLGVSTSLDALRTEFKQAEVIPSYAPTAKRLFLNLKTSDLNAAFEGMQLKNDLKGLSPLEWRMKVLQDMKGLECIGGLDLASTNDIVAFVMLFRNIKPYKKYIAIPFFWVSQSALKERDATHSKKRNYAQLNAWVDQGYISLIKHPTIQYSLVLKDIEELGADYLITYVIADILFQGLQACQELEKMGYKVETFKNNFAQHTLPTKHLSELISNGQLDHGNNPVLLWMFGNAMTESNHQGYIRFNKQKSKDKIDGVISLIMALNKYMYLDLKTGGKGKSVYNKRGIKVL